MPPEIRPIPVNQHKQCAQVLAEAFRGDPYLHKLMDFSENQSDRYWQVLCSIFFLADDVVILGAYEQERLIGAAIGFDDTFNPGLALNFLYNWRLLRRIGLHALWRKLQLQRIINPQIAMTQPCLRVLNIGVLPAFHKRGIASALLDAFAQVAFARGIDRLQVESGAENPASDLYKQYGFEVTRTFKLEGLSFHVMQKGLSE